MDLDLKALIYFAHIARSRSFSRSALELGVSQPWLSARIKRLEERLSCKLFLRTTRQIELTSEARQLLPAAEALANSATACEITARDLRGNAGRRIKIGSPPYASHVSRRIGLIEQFAAVTRAVIELDIGWSRYLLDHLRRGDLDAAFIIETIDTDWLEVMPFCTLQPSLIAKTTDPLANSRIVTPHDMAGRDIGVFTRNLNPAFFDTLFTPLLTAGAKLIELPEVNYDTLASDHPGTPSLLFSLNAVSGVIGKTYTGLTRLRLADIPEAQLLLVRRRGLNAPMCERFWAMAKTFCQPYP